MEKNRNTDSYFAIIIIPFLMLFLMPFFVLSFLNHPQNDDFVFTMAVDNWGIVLANCMFYYCWIGRYFSTALMTINPLVFHSFTAYKFCTFFLLTAMLLANNFLLKRLLATGATVWLRLLASLILMCLYLNTMPNLPEGIYWLTGAATYQVGSILTLLILGMFIDEYDASLHYNQKWRRIILLLLCFIASGTNEITMLTILLASGSIFMFRIIVMRKVETFYLCLAGVATTSSTLLMLAPGTATRYRLTEHPHLSQALLASMAEASTQMLIWAFNIPTLLMLTILALLSAKHIRRGLTLPFRCKPVYLLIWFFAVYFILYAPSYCGTGHIETRTLNVIFHYFLVGEFIALLLFFDYLSSVTNSPLKIRSVSQLALLAAASALLVVYPKSNIRVAWSDLLSGSAINYNQALNRRYDLIQSCSTHVCMVPPLINPPKTMFFFESAYDKTTDEDGLKRYKISYAMYFNKALIQVDRR